MIFTDGIRLATEGENNELHQFASILGLEAKWTIYHETPNYEILTEEKLITALKYGATPIPKGNIFPGEPFTIPEDILGTTKENLLYYNKEMSAVSHESYLNKTARKYTKKDLVSLRNTLYSYKQLEGVVILLLLLEAREHIEDPRDHKLWVKCKIDRLDREYGFVVDFLQLPFTRIPLVINKYDLVAKKAGKEGVAHIILKWRLEIGT